MKPLWVALLIALSPLTAQTAELVTPGGGSILQQIQPITPRSPSPSGTGLTIERTDGAKVPPSIPFLVKQIQITGNKKFDTATLHALVADGEGKNLTLSQLNELVVRITDYYHSHGYPLTRAIIPEQAIRDGIVRIEIIVARYGKIRLDNRSEVNDNLLQATLTPIQSGQIIGQAEMDHALLLLSDTPGVVVNATLKPGEAVGTSDLLVETAPGPAISGHVTLDDYGNRYTGKARISGMLDFIDPLHNGDVLSVSGLTSGKDLNFGYIAYESWLNGQGTRVGGSYSTLNYILGGPVSPLDAHGTAWVGSLWVKHPLVRSRDVNLYGRIQYDRLQLRDHIDSSAIQTDRTLKNWQVSLAGDTRDSLIAGAVNTWNVGWTTGHVSFDDGAAQLADAATAKTQGGFSKWNANLARLQNLTQKSALYLALSGQWSNANLDPSEKMTAGGSSTVRAYDMGALSSDTGYMGIAEFRYDLGAAWQGQWQAVVFVESAHVTINKILWVAEANSTTLTGAGIGLNWWGPDQWSTRIHIAAPVGQTPVLVGSTSSTRTWIAISKAF